MNLEFVCPDCRHRLERDGDDSLRCVACCAQYSIVGGVPHFTTGDGYWGEIPAADMQALIQSMRDRHWLRALEQADSAAVRAKRSFIADHRRANWVFELPLDARSRVLDVGCGMGSISAELAKHVGEVVALEEVELRAAFCATRFAQDELDNVRVVRADAFKPPFPEAYFDAILLNGVLEWLGKGQPERVREVQLQALQTLRRLLRADGYLIVAIENRWAVGSFRGRLDHSYLRYTSVMPRWLANTVTRARRGHGYDTYTYGHPGYLRLFAEAGFDNTRTLLPVWGYNNPAYFVPLSPRVRPTVVRMLSLTGGREARWPFLRKLERNLRLSRHVPEDFLFLARRGAETRSSWLHAHLESHWDAWQLGGDGRDLELVYHNGAIPTAIVFASGARPAQAVVKLAPRGAVDAFSAPCCEIQALRELQSTLSEPLRGQVPRPLALDQIHRHDVAVMTYLAGQQAALPPGSADSGGTRRSVARLVERGLQWLEKAGHCQRTDLVHLDAEALCSAVQGAAVHLGDAGLELETRALDHVRDHWPAAGFDVQDVKQHGDFVLPNMLLVDGDIAVIDWERFGRIRVPYFDAIHFVVHLMLMVVSNKGGWRPAESVSQFLDPSPTGREARRFLDPYLQSIGIDPALMPVLLTTSLLAYAREYGSDPRRRGMMLITAQQLAAVLG